MRTCELHALMLAQTSERRETGRAVRQGDLFQLDRGGYLEVLRAESAGVLLDKRAHVEIWKRGSAAGRCAMYGSGRAIKEGE